jgi:hypothetical protein
MWLFKNGKKVYCDKDDYTNTEIISSSEKIEVTCTKHNHTFTKNIQNLN